MIGIGTIQCTRVPIRVVSIIIDEIIKRFESKNLFISYSLFLTNGFTKSFINYVFTLVPQYKHIQILDDSIGSIQQDTSIGPTVQEWVQKMGTKVKQTTGAIKSLLSKINKKCNTLFKRVSNPIVTKNIQTNSIAPTYLLDGPIIYVDYNWKKGCIINNSNSIPKLNIKAKLENLLSNVVITRKKIAPIVSDENKTADTPPLRPCDIRLQRSKQMSIPDDFNLQSPCFDISHHVYI